MKRNILFMILGLLVSGTALLAQDTIVIQPAPSFFATADLQDASTMPDDVVAHSFVVSNASGGQKTYVWERTLEDLPEGWLSAVCDTNQCYFPSVSSREFILGPGDLGRMDSHAYPNSIPGEGTVHIRVWEKDNPSEFEVGVYTFCVSDGPNSPVNCSLTSTSDLEKQSLKVFPNPATDYFQLSENTAVEYIEVYNLIGARIASFRGNTSARHDIAALSQGMYLLQLRGEKGTLLKTMKLIKE